MTENRCCGHTNFFFGTAASRSRPLRKTSSRVWTPAHPPHPAPYAGDPYRRPMAAVAAPLPFLTTAASTATLTARPPLACLRTLRSTPTCCSCVGRDAPRPAPALAVAPRCGGACRAPSLLPHRVAASPSTAAAAEGTPYPAPN